MENTLVEELPLGEVNSEGNIQRLCFDHGYYIGKINWDVFPGCENDWLDDDGLLFGDSHHTQKNNMIYKNDSEFLGG